jgi:hypothetical protein
VRYVTTLPDTEPPLRVSATAKAMLSGYLQIEIEDALSSRNVLEQSWRGALRRYEGVPKNPYRTVPFENAPNIEVTLGAIACDSIYAQAIDLIYTASPPITCRAVDGRSIDAAKALQRFVNWGAENEFKMREATDHALLDDIQLGTGVYYIPFVEQTKKTKVARVTARGPMMVPVPLEDFLVPGGAYGDLQVSEWCAMRTWMTRAMLDTEAKLRGWDTDHATEAAAVDWVRSQRELLGMTSSPSRRLGDLFEIFHVYCYYDIDNDGLQEDLRVIYDRSAAKILKIGYNPYDKRPFEASRYQLRAHLFYGLGVMDMLAPFQDEATELHNARTANVLIANTRMWKAKRGQVDENMTVWPGKVIAMDDPDSLKGEQLGDVYPSAFNAEAITLQLAERRSGVNEIAKPSQVFGSRTPGITALSMLQQVNRRFTPAFDQMRLSIAGAVRQCLYRYQEQLLSGDRLVESKLVALLGEQDGALVIELLKSDDFDESIAVEMTAASASVNREADRQNALLLVNVLAQYYQRVLELTTIAAQPTTPEPVREVALKIGKAAGEIIDRTLRAFDQVRDPQTFIVELDDTVDGMQGLDQAGLAGLVQIIGQAQQAQNGMGALPAATSP